MSTTMGSLETYRLEIFSFLRTVTIKFDPFAYLMGESIMLQTGLNDPHAEWNPYYINLSGNYAQGDTPMTVYSLEEERDVIFDLQLVEKYPKTASLYKVPNTEYFTLLERYPENTGLIKAIAYPNGKIKEIIDKPNLTLLGYDDTLLPSGERSDMVSCLREFLSMVRTRWWIEEYTYEDMYAVTFWAMLWQFLPMVLLYRRFDNIRTDYTHPFHVWEYVKSKGLGDFRDVLTERQTYWLYRNIDYIQKNKGKNENLTILAENLLEDVAVSLLEKDLVQTVTVTTGSDTDESDDESSIVTIPVIDSTNVVTGEYEKTESFPEFNDRLVESGLENDNSAEYEDETSKELATHPHNKLPTKFLEFKKRPINSSKEALMVNFFIDTLMYRLSENTCSYTCSFTDPYTKTPITLSVHDIVLLWHYSIWKSLGVTPIVIPTKFKVHLPYKRTKPTKNEITEAIYYQTNAIYLNKYINITDLLNGCQWYDKIFTSVDKFMEILISQFKKLLLMEQYYENSNLYQFRASLKQYYIDISEYKWLTLNLTAKTTFVEWKDSNEKIATLFEVYDTIDDEEEATQAFASLGNACYDALFPMTGTYAEEFVSTSGNMERIYEAIRDLFIKLGSYNITYLENEREQRQYLYVHDPVVVMFATYEYTVDNLFNLVIDSASFLVNDLFGNFNQELPDKQIDIDFTFNKTDFSVEFDKVLYMLFSIDNSITWQQQKVLKTNTDIEHKTVVYDISRKITMHQTSVRKQPTEG